MTEFKGLPSFKSKTARLALDPIKGKRPYWATISPGVSLGYRRNADAGTWVVRVTACAKPWTDRIATADDFAPECAPEVLGFEAALERARLMARAPKGGAVVVADDAPITLDEALTAYEADLGRRGGDPANARRPRPHLPGALLNKPVMMLTSKELKVWCGNLVGSKGIKTQAISRSTINRTISALAAAITLAAEDDARIDVREIKKGLKKFAEADEACNVVFKWPVVEAWIAEANKRSRKLGIYMEVLAETGTRPSQAARIPVCGFKDGEQPTLLIPRSGKGGARDRLRRKRETTVAMISHELAAALRDDAAGRAPNAPLLTRENGEAWDVGKGGKSVDASQHYRNAVADIVAALVAQGHINADVDPATVTAYALRHSAIVRQILDNVPEGVVATSCDTSVAKIRSNYGKHLDRHADDVMRRGVARRAPVADNVVKLRTA